MIEAEEPYIDNEMDAEASEEESSSNSTTSVIDGISPQQELDQTKQNDIETIMVGKVTIDDKVTTDNFTTRKESKGYNEEQSAELVLLKLASEEKQLLKILEANELKVSTL